MLRWGMLALVGAAAAAELKIFLLAGQSNMEGVSLGAQSLGGATYPPNAARTP